MNAKILFTGGGTAGHVTPNLALIERLKEEGVELAYIGEKNGVEQALVKGVDIPFYPILAGKFRRYFSLKNLTDPFKIMVGLCQALRALYQFSPDLVFSKGGFVSFPVVLAAWMLRIPVIVHESDMTPGLANRLCFPLATHICVNFPPARQHIRQKEKVVVTGSPVRRALFEGHAQKGLRLSHLNDEKPCVLAIGGSLGAQKINEVLRAALPQLLQTFQVIHLCGKGKLDKTLASQSGYFQMEYAHEELNDLFAAASLVVSRSGANSLYEILALQKPHVLIPLSLNVSRGDQIQNARYFKEQGVSLVMDEDKLTVDRLLEAIHTCWDNRKETIAAMKQLNIQSGADEILALIKSFTHHAPSPI